MKPITLAQYLGDEPRDRYLPHFIGACVAALLILCLGGCSGGVRPECVRSCAVVGMRALPVATFGFYDCRCESTDGGAK